MIRFFDILISILILIILSPIMITISFLIFFIDGSPIIYKQFRVGYMGKKFLILKFRTMKNVTCKNEKLNLTFIGKLLRKMSVDELPQFFNVLKKEMSIVGPRPLPHNIEKRIDKNIKIKRRKILPGLTGMSQINYTGKKRNLTEKIRLDMRFIEDYTLYNYLKIILKTPFVILVRFFKNKSSIIK
tara:strand:+ start:25195 stop:25752 length:558 start_codon:yes stop_codon:yes gene_type:complete